MKYLNSFYMPRNIYSRQFLECDTKPEEYKGYLIFHRLDSTGTIKSGSHIFDIVKNGVCVGMYAGPNGAKSRINQLNEGVNHENYTH